MNTVIKYTPVTGGGWTESMHRVIKPEHLDSTNHEISLVQTSNSTPIWGDHPSASTSRTFAYTSFEEEGNEGFDNE